MKKYIIAILMAFCLAGTLRAETYNVEKDVTADEYSYGEHEDIDAWFKENEPPGAYPDLIRVLNPNAIGVTRGKWHDPIINDNSRVSWVTQDPSKVEEHDRVKAKIEGRQAIGVVYYVSVLHVGTGNGNGNGEIPLRWADVEAPLVSSTLVLTDNVADPKVSVSNSGHDAPTLYCKTDGNNVGSVFFSLHDAEEGTYYYSIPDIGSNPFTGVVWYFHIDPGAYTLTVTGDNDFERKINFVVVEVKLTVDDVLIAGGGEQNNNDEHAVVLVNDGFNEGNFDSDGNPVPDNEPEAEEGHRIVGDEDPIVSGSAEVVGLDSDAEGTWTLTYDDNIMLWREDGGEYIHFESGSESDLVSASEPFEFLVEGIEASENLDDVNLKAEFAPDPENDVNYGGEGEMTVAGVEIADTEYGGWAKVLSSLWNNNHPSQGADIGWSMYPCKWSPTDTTDRNEVMVVAEIKPAHEVVAEAVNNKGGVTFKSFDVYDPSMCNPTSLATEWPVHLRPDPNNPDENQGNTNRGGKGNFENNNNVISVDVIADKENEDVGKAKAPFTVTMHPGDNFRIAVAFTQLADKLDLLQVDNLPDEGADPQDYEYEQHFFLSELREEDPNGFGDMVSDLLTVWRRLHMEIDTMEEVSLDPECDQRNYADGQIVDMVGSPGETHKATTNIDFTNLPAGEDLSWHLDHDPVDHGRFENGRVRIGPGPVLLWTYELLGNCDERIHTTSNGTDTSFNILFAVYDNNTQLQFGQITNMWHSANGGHFYVCADSQPIEDDYEGKLLWVAGHEYTIVSNTDKVFVVDENEPALDFLLYDDDDLELLPHPDPDLSVLKAALDEAYIRVFENTTGVACNNDEVDFVLNVPDGEDLENHFDMQTTGADDDFWVAYHVVSYQWRTLSDRDPDEEGGTGGVVWGGFSNTFVATGAQGGQVFKEPLRERQQVEHPDHGECPPGLFARVLAHEIGHQMGLAHWDSGESGVPWNRLYKNLMLRTTQWISNSEARFMPEHIHLLRERDATPGQ